jgi:hypothetical protein
VQPIARDEPGHFTLVRTILVAKALNQLALFQAKGASTRAESARGRVCRLGVVDQKDIANTPSLRSRSVNDGSLRRFPRDQVPPRPRSDTSGTPASVEMLICFQY